MEQLYLLLDLILNSCVVGQIFALKDPSLKNKSSPHHVFKSYGFDMKKMIHCNYIDIKYNSRESTGLEYH